jgi:hypothetical protein
LVNCCSYCGYHCITINNYLLYCNSNEFGLYCDSQRNSYGQPYTISEHCGYFDDL